MKSTHYGEDIASVGCRSIFPSLEVSSQSSISAKGVPGCFKQSPDQRFSGDHQQAFEKRHAETEG